MPVRAPVRARLTPTPTPLQAAPRLSAAIGREVWIKRDDIGSIGYAGNKIRKLEYLVGEADARGADTLVIVGARQSNAARATAALCAATGRRCVIVVPDDAPAGGAPPEANALLSTLFGAELRHLGAGVGWADSEAASREIAASLDAGGATCLVLPAGCSSPLGAVGFLTAHAELLAQLDEAGLAPDAVVHASTSGGTAAGLHLGRLLHGGPPVLSVDVGRLFGDDTLPRIAALATDAATLAGTPHVVRPDDLTVTFAFLGDGYGAHTADGLAAIRLLARTEGIVCDPVYSGKALAAVCAGTAVPGDGPLVFWHTGGAQSIFSAHVAGALLDDGARS